MRKSKFSGIFLGLLAGAMVAGGLAGCTKAVSGSSTTNSATMYLSVMDLAPWTPSAQISLNGTAATSSISPGTYSTSYAPLVPGTYDVQFRVYGSDSVLADLGNSVYDSASYYTLILYNVPGSSNSRAVKIVDNFSTLSLSTANYRFFNMCPDFPSVDLYINSTVAQPGRTPADNVGNTSLNNFQSLNAAVYTIQAKTSGTDSVLATLSGVNLASGNAYTIFLTGSKSSTVSPISLNVLTATY
jgi:hypothetical protein